MKMEAEGEEEARAYLEGRGKRYWKEGGSWRRERGRFFRRRGESEIVLIDGRGSRRWMRGKKMRRRVFGWGG